MPKGLSRATRARSLSAIKQFYRFAYEEGWREPTTRHAHQGTGPRKRLPKTLSLDEVERLLPRRAQEPMAARRPTGCAIPA